MASSFSWRAADKAAENKAVNWELAERQENEREDIGGRVAFDQKHGVGVEDDGEKVTAATAVAGACAD